MFDVCAWARALGFACLAFVLVGCYPADNSAGEDDNPLIKAAVSRKSASPADAAKLLERALEGNPRLARAHWELGLLCLNNTSNYAGAVYHFQKVLDLRPNWPHASTARQLISNAKLELVKEGVEAPTLPSVQRQMDRLVEELHRLTQQRTSLLASVQYLTGVTQQLAAENLELRQRLLGVAGTLPLQGLPATNASPGVRAGSPPSGQTPGNRSTPPVSGATRPTPGIVGQRGVGTVTPYTGTRFPSASSSPRAPASSARTYTVRRGETAFSICRRFGLTTRDLVAVNPGLDPGRLKVGQTINLPAR